jgi:hypothetical protein
MVKEWVCFVLQDVSHSDPNRTCCQMLLMAEYDWFKKFVPNTSENDNRGEYFVETSSQRLVGYNEIKERWRQRCLEIFFRYFPKARGRIAVADISTPLSIQYYLRAPHGGAVGLDVCPSRFVDATVREALDPISKVPGLALTGQDVALCGVTLCQVSCRSVKDSFFLKIFMSCLLFLLGVGCNYSFSIGGILCGSEDHLTIATSW